VAEEFNGHTTLPDPLLGCLRFFTCLLREGRPALLLQISKELFTLL